MKIALVSLCLLSFLPQTQTPEPRIALIIRDKTVIVKKSKAERLLRSEDLHLRKAAEIALGTQPDTVSDLEIQLLTPQEAERFRWLREPLQGRQH